MLIRLINGTVLELPQASYSRDAGQDVETRHTVDTALTNIRRRGTPMEQWTIKGDIMDPESLPWKDIAAVSLDGHLWRECVLPSATFPDNKYHQSAYELRCLVSPLLEGATLRFPSSGYYWFGSSAALAVSQPGTAPAGMRLVYQGPSCFWPLTNDLLDIAGLGVAFTRALAKVHTGITYAANVPIFDLGLYLGGDTSADVATVTLPAATVRTVALKLYRTNASSTGGDIWITTNGAAVRNHLSFSTGTSLLSWSDGTTTVSVAFPTSIYNGGYPVDVVVIEDANHAVTLAVYDGSTWVTATGTLAALNWNQLTLGTFLGSLSNLVQYPYCLTSAEYQHLISATSTFATNRGPVVIGALYITPKFAGSLTKTSDGRLETAAGDDISAMLSGTEPQITTTPLTLSQTNGLPGRWHVEVKETYLP